MRLRFVSVPALMALVGAACAAGCSLVTGYDGFTGAGASGDGRDGGASDSGAPDATMSTVDSGDAGMTTEETLCAPDIPPPPSGQKSESNVSSYAGVVTNIRFTPVSGGCPIIGKNLDGLVTACPADAGQACTPGYGSGNCDLVGGVDNQAQTGLESFLGGNALVTLPEDLAMQRTGFVLTLSSYGGELDNPAVNVGFESDVAVADGGTVVDQASIVSGDRPAVETQGYVTNGVLVASFGTTPVPLHFTQTVPDGGRDPGVHGVTIPIAYATIIGHPVLEDGGLTMNDAQIVGRIEVVDLVNALSSLAFCVNADVAGQFCQELDLPSAPGMDGTSAYCGAISFGMGFDLAPTVVVGSGLPLPGVDLCGSDSPPVTPLVCNPPSIEDAGDDGGGDAGTDAQGIFP